MEAMKHYFPQCLNSDGTPKEFISVEDHNRFVKDLIEHFEEHIDGVIRHFYSAASEVVNRGKRNE